MSPAPGSAHQLIVGNLHVLIREFLRQQPIGVVMLAPFDVVFSQIASVVEPDLIYFSRERFKAVVGEKTAAGAPDLAIEVLSPSSRQARRSPEAAPLRTDQRVGILDRGSGSRGDRRLPANRRPLREVSGVVVGTGRQPQHTGPAWLLGSVDGDLRAALKLFSGS